MLKLISYKYLKSKIKDVRSEDIASIFPMLVAILISPLYKQKYKRSWLICEEKQEARDNGYWFYRKMKENHPEQSCIYAIDKNSVDYNNVKKLGDVVQFGSLKHWIIYFTCEYNISSQKGGKPNAAICSFIELNDLYNAHNIFLQHGIIINDLEWLHADKCRFDIFVTSTFPERDFVKNKFGYGEDIIKLTGLPRFDNLHQQRTNNKRILIMPTWRYWFNLKSKQLDYLDKDFKNSEYLFKWKELLESKQLDELITKHNLEVIFYPHRNMQSHLHEMKESINTKVIFASWKDYNLQELLITSALMITDYSSVFFDMIYMKKPIIFYQFDNEKFRKGQYKEGYFDYFNNPFGNSYQEIEPLMHDLQKNINNNFSCSDLYLSEYEKHFSNFDVNNSDRVYMEILKKRGNYGK